MIPALPEGIELLLFGAALAGLVRGFSGFGSAMVYLSIAGQVLPPFEVLTTLVMIELIGPMPLVPRALRDGHVGDVIRLCVGATFAVPIGLAVLLVTEPEVFRYAVSIVSIGLLALLISGYRYRGPMNPPLVFATGGAGGFLAGAVGLPGPPVILLYMASDRGPAVTRANTLLYLLAADVIVIAVMRIYGVLVPTALWVGLLLIPVNLLGNLAGGAMFRPEKARIYRAVGYAIIALSALSGLPILD